MVSDNRIYIYISTNRKYLELKLQISRMRRCEYQKKWGRTKEVNTNYDKKNFYYSDMIAIQISVSMIKLNYIINQNSLYLFLQKSSNTETDNSIIRRDKSRCL